MDREERRKIEWLEQYGDLLKEEDDILKEIEAIETEIIGLKAPTNDGMPRGGSGKDIEKLILKKDSALVMLIAKRCQVADHWTAIRNTIMKIPESKYRRLMRMKYLENKTWEWIAVELEKSYKTVAFDWHHKALKFIKIPESKLN